MSHAYNLGCNATSIQAANVISWGLLTTLLVGISTICFYWFWITTLARAMYWKPTEWEWSSTEQFRVVDIILGQFIPFLVMIGFYGWMIWAFLDKNRNFDDFHYSLLDPQDIANVFYVAISMFIVTWFKFYQFAVSIDKNNLQKEGSIRNTSGDEKTPATMFALFCSVFAPVSCLMAICLFGGAFGFLQANKPHEICQNPITTQTWLEASTFPYSLNVGSLHLSSGILLALALGVHLIMPIANAPGGSKWKVISNFVSFEKFLFGITGDTTNQRAVVMGWIPTLHLGFWFTMSFTVFFAMCFVYTHNDLYKAIGVYFAVCLNSLVLAGASGTLDTFTAFFFASLFCFYFVQFAATFVRPVGEKTMSAETIDYGVFFTGPALAANVDTYTVYVFTVFELTLSILTCSLAFYGQKMLSDDKKKTG